MYGYKSTVIRVRKMKKNGFLIICLLQLLSCNAKQEKWTLISNSDEFSPYSSGYVNEQGKIVVPIGKYIYCFTEKFEHIAIVLPKNSKHYVAIDRQERVLFNVLSIDNGPDIPKEGLFRIIENGKIGYANMKGEIVIKPKFDLALPFESYGAEVNIEGKKITVGEYETVTGGKWGLINKKGEYIITPSYTREELLKKIELMR